MGQTSIYRYVMYLVTLNILLIIDSETQIQKAKTSYLLEIFMLIVVMLINTNEIVTISGIAIVFLSIGITKLIYHLKNTCNHVKKEQKDMTEIYKFGYLFSLTNIILWIGNLYFIYH